MCSLYASQSRGPLSTRARGGWGGTTLLLGQETEQALEELKQAHAEKKSMLEEQTSGLSEQLETLRAQIREEEARSASLQTQIDSS